MTAARRVADLTEDELRELVAAAAEEGVRRARAKKPRVPDPPPAPPVEYTELDARRAEEALRRFGRVPAGGGRGRKKGR